MMIRQLPVVWLTVSLALIVGCEKSDELAERCAKALSKVALDEKYRQGEIDPGEQAIMDAVRKVSQSTCEAEGLTPEQAACFDTIVDIVTLFRAADCPALAAKQPSWFHVPPPEVRHRALENMHKTKPSND